MLKAGEVLKRLNISRKSLYNYERNGYINHTRDINGRRLYKEEDVEKLKMLLLSR